MTGKKIRILIGDDTEVTRKGWTVLLQSIDEFEVIGSAKIPSEMVVLTNRLHPDIIVTDLKWGGDETAGIVIIAEIRKNQPSMPIIAISAYEQLLDDAKRMGANAVITKDFSLNEFEGLIKHLAE